MKDEKSTAKTLALVSAFAFEMILLIGVLFFLGRFIDSKIATTPLFTVLLSFIGIVFGVIHLIRRANSMED